MVDINKLLQKSRNRGISRIQEAVKASVKNSGGGAFEKDSIDGLWKLTVDGEGRGAAIIRFLDRVDGKDELPWIRYWDHSFVGPTGKYYINYSLTSKDLPDPLFEYNRYLWDIKREDQARNQKRVLHYMAYIYVVKDYANPENNGKVFKFLFGKEILQKIESAISPDAIDIELNGAEPIIPYDFWNGADFVLQAFNKEGKSGTTKDGYRSYSKSTFKSPSPLANGDEDEMKKILSQVGNLDEDFENIGWKTYEQLDARLKVVLGAPYIEWKQMNGMEQLGTTNIPHVPEEKDDHPTDNFSDIPFDGPYKSDEPNDDVPNIITEPTDDDDDVDFSFFTKKS